MAPSDIHCNISAAAIKTSREGWPNTRSLFGRFEQIPRLTAYERRLNHAFMQDVRLIAGVPLPDELGTADARLEDLLRSDPAVRTGF